MTVVVNTVGSLDHKLSPIKVVSRYHTGLVHEYESNGLVFQWHDWVLCEVAWGPGNPTHHAVCSGFRQFGSGSMEIIDHNKIEMTMLNPTYDRMEHRVIGKLTHFKPVSVILSERLGLKGVKDATSTDEIRGLLP